MRKYLYSGFTLIEILIVITVIGILVAVAVPNYQQYIKKARESACLSEVRNYSNAVFYTLNGENNNRTLPIAPVLNACQSITDATGWTLDTQQKIVAVAKAPSNVRIECDIPHGTPCVVLP